MDFDEAKQRISKHPVLRFAGVLVAGFMAGVGLMRWLESYSGVTMMVKAEERELRDSLKKFTDQAQSLSEQNAELTRKNAQITASTSKSEEGLASCRADREVLSRQTADLSAQLGSANSDKGKCDAAQREARVSAARAQENAQLKSANESQRAEIQRLTSATGEMAAELARAKDRESALVKPGGSAPIVVYKSQSTPPGTLLEYFDGALTLAAETIYPTRACIRTNLDSTCKDARVGDVISVQIAGKRYGIRIDKIHVPYHIMPPTDPHNSIAVSILRMSQD